MHIFRHTRHSASLSHCSVAVFTAFHFCCGSFDFTGSISSPDGATAVRIHSERLAFFEGGLFCGVTSLWLLNVLQV